MKRWLTTLSALVLGLALLAEPTRSGPVDGWYEKVIQIEPGSPGTHSFIERFHGGRRACVILTGDHKPVVDLAIEVRDMQGRVVAKDDVKTGNRVDYAAAIWYPPTDAAYTITLMSYSDPEKPEYNKCRLVVK